MVLLQCVKNVIKKCYYNIKKKNQFYFIKLDGKNLKYKIKYLVPKQITRLIFGNPICIFKI